MAINQRKILTVVAPFECSWNDDLRFREGGRGCVAFDAFAQNDVTVVFRERVGSQHYHYKRDDSPHYTVIIGSHRNRRLKIEVDGETAVDAAAVDLCCSASTFQSYWICVYDGLISVGKGRNPFHDLCFKWHHSNPNCRVQYVGLSSWDKHVGYRNVQILPHVTLNHSVSLWEHVDHHHRNDGCENGNSKGELVGDTGGEFEASWGGLENYLESWELSDVIFMVGKDEGRAVPAHKVILAASGDFSFTSSGKDVINLHNLSYPVLHAFLQYIYTGHTQISECEVNSLEALSLQFKVTPLLKQCEEIVAHFSIDNRLLDSGKNAEISYVSRVPCIPAFPYGLPINTWKLEQFFLTGKYSDLEIYVGDFIVQSHKVILGLWSAPFSKMFSNGMKESFSSTLALRDVNPEAFRAMLEFLYTGKLKKEIMEDINTLLLQLLLLADKFGVYLLHQECCKAVLEHLKEDTVCPVLQVIASVLSCKLIEEAYEREFAVHFDYCTTASNEFVMLDEATFSVILQHPELTVTSEENVLNAIFCWSLQAEEYFGWERIDEMMMNSTPEVLFGQRLTSLDLFFPFVRFSLLPHALLEKLQRSEISKQIPIFHHLVKEAITFLQFGSTCLEKNYRFQHRRSSFKEHQYICDGDSNGVFYFAGTSYGAHQWMNPVLCKRVNITASSPFSRFTDPKVLVSRNFQGTSFAGPQVESGNISSWWMVDLGHDHQLMCNYYTIRQDGSRTFMRSWNFQGSGDGVNWTNLIEHKEDQTICKPGQFASWPVIGSGPLFPFRFFRILMTGPSADEVDIWNCSICFLELYGYFL
ncbi:unnamed protein product [Cuscuta epithymum]|uniref:BTB domain-containing protein n=1 Tax=Cuscuta epithymum TaxID=186058 RepID=A0AAV0GBE3_9ASTE|nr:unnamed protein product [Cuscuta epithymum]